MTVRIEALSSIIEWDADAGAMLILNPGDVAEVGDALAEAKILTGEARKTKKKSAAAAGNDEAAEQAPADEPAVEDAPAAEDEAPVA